MLQATSSRETRDSAREVKFVLPADRAERVLAWARSRLAPDTYGGGPAGDEYRTTTIYFDTETRAVYERQGSYGRSKYRLRRYGTSDIVFLERKMRTSTRLSKRRTAIAAREVEAQLTSGQAADPAIRWFVDRLRVRRLIPVCQVTYRRHALVGLSPNGPMRLTVDYDLTAQPNRTRVFVDGEGVPVIPGFAILEMKFCVDSPAVFRQIVTDFQLSAAPVSKYRLAGDALDALEAASRHEERTRQSRPGDGHATDLTGYANA